MHFLDREINLTVKIQIYTEFKCVLFDNAIVLWYKLKSQTCCWFSAEPYMIILIKYYSVVELSFYEDEVNF